MTAWAAAAAAAVQTATGLLHLSEATAKAQVSQVMAKLGAASRVQIAVLAHQAGPE
ncbi:LuxR C-terminal-related transcriptional regulator [Streptomyces sp. NPDC001594]|uniref:LuxR C-terminal-related transcriptional regulator n=1 Tax=Streptomyces sp. NPDC001594 TaxID=3364590 RepID=UPI0036A4A057